MGSNSLSFATWFPLGTSSCTSIIGMSSGIPLAVGCQDIAVIWSQSVHVEDNAQLQLLTPSHELVDDFDSRLDCLRVLLSGIRQQFPIQLGIDVGGVPVTVTGFRFVPRPGAVLGKEQTNGVESQTFDLIQHTFTQGATYHFGTERTCPRTGRYTDLFQAVPVDRLQLNNLTSTFLITQLPTISRKVGDVADRFWISTTTTARSGFTNASQRNGMGTVGCVGGEGQVSLTNTCGCRFEPQLDHMRTKRRNSNTHGTISKSPEIEMSSMISG